MIFKIESEVFEMFVLKGEHQFPNISTAVDCIHSSLISIIKR